MDGVDKQDLATTPHAERRAHPRFAVEEQATVLVVGHGMSFTGRVVNLSLDGCRIDATANLSGGGRIRVEVTFTINGLPFRMGGAIRWCDGKSLGIQFVRVSPTRHIEWANVIDEIKAQEAKRAAEEAAKARREALAARDSELVQIMDASLADAALRAGDWLVCREGCTQCCYGAFAINALDAARLRAGMDALRATAPEIAKVVEGRAHAWIAQYGPSFPGDVSTGVLGASEGECARFEEFADDAPCPALDVATGRCDVYACRPMTCRVFGPPVRAAGEGGEEGLGHCELCFAGATDEQIATCEMPVPHEFEAELLREVGDERETVVAFALLASDSE